MMRRIFTALTAICILVLIYAAPNSAQESRTSGSRTTTVDRQIEQRGIITTEAAESMRGDMIAGYSELEALLKLYADYPAFHSSFTMVTYDDVMKELADEHSYFQSLPVEDLMRQSQLPTNAKIFRRMATVLERVRTDGRFLTALEKANRYMLASGGNAAAVRVAMRDLRIGDNLVAAPSFIKPDCNYADPNDYASASDLGITNSIIIAESTVIDSLPDSFSVAGFSAPNVARIALVIARGVTEEILNGLEISNGNGSYCEALRFFIEDKMKDNEGYIVILAVPYSQGGYLDYVKDSVNAVVSEAQGRGFPLNCAQMRLTEANNFFNNGVWLQAYKKYQAAFQNIGASSCVQ